MGHRVRIIKSFFYKKFREVIHCHGRELALFIIKVAGCEQLLGLTIGGK
jgi:hypothetical protein